MIYVSGSLYFGTLLSRNIEVQLHTSTT